MTIKDISKNIPKYIISDFNLLLKYIRNNNEIMNFISNNNLSISEIAYLLKNNFDIKDITCALGNKKRFTSKFKGYRKFCGNIGSCLCNRNNQKFYIDNRSEQDKLEIQKKRRQTNLKKYGVDIASKSDIVKKHQEITMIKKFGVKSPTLNKNILKKIQETNFKRRGVNWPTQDKIIFKKSQKTCFKNHGVLSPIKSKIIQDKIKKTCIEKYGASSPFESKKIKQKIKQILFNKYGVYHGSQVHINEESFKKLNNKNWLENKNKTKEIIEIAKELGVSVKTIHIKFNEFGIKFNKKYRSKYELEIRTFLETIYHKKIIHSRKDIIKPYELDIYLPDIKLAIEFNGIYWHSESINRTVDKNYHLNKTELCEKQNIHLIHIFENEWVNKKEIIKKKLCNIILNKQIKIKNINVIHLPKNIKSIFF